MKKMTILISVGVIALIAVVVSLFARKKKATGNNADTNGDGNGITEYTDAPKPPLLVQKPDKQTPIFEITDPLAQKAIEGRMRIIHSAWKKGSDGGVDILNGTTGEFRQTINAKLATQNMSAASTKIGYSDDFVNFVQAYSGNPVTGNVKELGKDYVWANIITPFLLKANTNSMGGADFSLTDAEAMNLWKKNREYCCKDVTKMEWLMHDYGVMMGNVLKVAISYRESLKEKAIQELRASGWKFTIYDNPF